MARFVKILIVLGVLAVLALAGLAYARRMLDSYFNRGTVVTPGLVGKTLEDAIQSTPLAVKIASRVASSDVQPGRIIAQDPPAGTPVNTSKTILVILSAGANLVDVPALIGQPLRKAKLALSEVHLAQGQLCSMSSSKPRDTILAQYPPPGEKLGKGGLVDLLVSAGPASGPSPLPRVVGLEAGRARATLEKLGFTKIEEVERQGPPGIEEKIVFDQEPAPGSSAGPAQRIVLSVATRRPPEPVQPVPPEVSEELKRLEFEFTMPPGLTPKRLDVYQSEDGANRRSIYSREHQPAEKVVIPAEGAGKVELEFFVDDVAYGREQF